MKVVTEASQQTGLYCILQYLKMLMSIQIPLQVNTQSYKYIHVCRWIKFDCTSWGWNETVIHMYCTRSTFLHHGRRVTSICKASPNTFTYVHCLHKHIPVNMNMQHCNTSVASHRAIWQHCWIAVYISLGLKIITGVQALANTIRWSQKGSTPFGNLHCSVPWHCSRSPTEASYFFLAFLRCSQKWSVAPLHMKWGGHNGIWLDLHIDSASVHNINWYTHAHNITQQESH